MDFLEGNIVKYISRYKYKNGIEDLQKARTYLDKLIGIESCKLLDGEKSKVGISEGIVDELYLTPFDNDIHYQKELNKTLDDMLQNESKGKTKDQLISEEVIELVRGYQGKFSPNYEINVSKEAIEIFREKIKKGEI